MWTWLASRDALAARPGSSGAARTTRMPAAWPTLLDHLIPADELTPSATQLQIDKRLWSEVLKDDDYARLVRFGCEWLDRYHPEGFRGLGADEREQLVLWMSQAPWEAPQRRFFELVRDHAMKLYYLEPVAMRGTPLERPPQPGGRSIDRVLKPRAMGGHKESRDA
ncbi:MAG TPA: gluconate 2-dehydrogenase subunit 3 family protein [Aquabacterium sp.]|uniref:gluconate 2-dehydrogenase subunit 3 family protein n=1 Tax=Aquabacterium sp. TaxID=1872578 RepID=UPI002E36CA7A|nr:gluconate 2-dehydrogenase subunit 3 family protein [Aquabacterium sp.]HEX5372440.1 gluconate 2-dehydrogenase subunit 3 family protein [Aquabacterium sp.]